MNSPLDTIEYLARSDHRVEVLDAIRTTPRTREEIRDLTDASRVTAGRIIADLEDRGWIVRRGTEYEATTSGRFVAREFSRLMRNLEA
jgi:predicted transcriptional regulator